MVSDDHAGLRAARRAVWPSISWQRCQFHLAQNAQAHAHNRQQAQEMGQAIRDIFNSLSLADAEAMLTRVAKRFAKENPPWVKWLEENIAEGFTVYRFPRSTHKKIRTVNGLERVNKEIRRRTPPGGGNLSPRSIGAAAHLGCACGDTRGVVNRPAIPEPGRLEKTSGAILPYRPSRKLQKNSCLTHFWGKSAGQPVTQLFFCNLTESDLFSCGLKSTRLRYCFPISQSS